MKNADQIKTNRPENEPAMTGIELEQVLKALGDPVRLSVVRQLLASKGEERACGTFDYSVTKATFSHHLAILREAGIITSRLVGTTKLTSLRTRELKKHFPGLLEMIQKSDR